MERVHGSVFGCLQFFRNICCFLVSSVGYLRWQATGAPCQTRLALVTGNACNDSALYDLVRFILRIRQQASDGRPSPLVNIMRRAESFSILESHCRQGIVHVRDH